jgi:hypothetical protein
MCSLLVSRDREQFVAVVVVVIIILVCAAAILCDRSIDVRGGLKSGVSLFFSFAVSAVCRLQAVSIKAVRSSPILLLSNGNCYTSSSVKVPARDNTLLYIYIEEERKREKK